MFSVRFAVAVWVAPVVPGHVATTGTVYVPAATVPVRLNGNVSVALYGLISFFWPPAVTFAGGPGGTASTAKRTGTPAGGHVHAEAGVRLHADEHVHGSRAERDRGRRDREVQTGLEDREAERRRAADRRVRDRDRRRAGGRVRRDEELEVHDGGRLDEERRDRVAQDRGRRRDARREARDRQAVRPGRERKAAVRDRRGHGDALGRVKVRRVRGEGDGGVRLPGKEDGGTRQKDAPQAPRSDAPSHLVAPLRWPILPRGRGRMRAGTTSFSSEDSRRGLPL